jgi:hypothetical protein
MFIVGDRGRDIGGETCERRRERDREKHTEGKRLRGETDGKKQRSESEGKRQRGRDRG